jgi:chlorophyll(ide) b reductase
MNVIITGSTKGLGKALAEEFLKFGDNVIISSRDNSRVEIVVKEFQSKYPKSKVFGKLCDVSKITDVTALSQFAVEKLGTVDIWINNAGTSGYIHCDLSNMDPNVIKLIVDTNLLGTLYGIRSALQIMLPNKSGIIFNIEGLGSNGMPSPKMVPYGATKAGFPQILKSLKHELKGTGVGVHNLSPGMMITEFITIPIESKNKKIINILADLPTDVAKWAVPKMRMMKGNGKRLKYLTTAKAFVRFMTAGKRKNRFYDENGNYIN